MLGQLKLFAALPAAVAIATFFSFAGAAHAELPVVKGTGLPRSERDCLQSLPAFKKRLHALGFKMAAPLECQEVLGENDTYAPAFSAVAAEPMAAVTAAGQLYPSRGACEKTLEWMSANAVDANERVVESACVEVSVVSQYEDELEGGQFQPMLILVKKTERAPAREKRTQVDCKFTADGAECVGDR